MSGKTLLRSSRKVTTRQVNIDSTEEAAGDQKVRKTRQCNSDGKVHNIDLPGQRRDAPRANRPNRGIRKSVIREDDSPDVQMQTTKAENTLCIKSDMTATEQLIISEQTPPDGSHGEILPANPGSLDLIAGPSSLGSSDQTVDLSMPLADITENTINSKYQHLGLEGESKVLPPNLEFSVPTKPMDIVIRTRARHQPELVTEAKCQSRLVITHLMLTNFKSYAGKQQVGPFHTSFSSVVGPNGSGKSNVIDSLLFVFGFRASKMRQGKVSALIHNSANYPNLDSCEVQVHFQEIMDLPGGNTECIPESTLIISRKAFKNNSSKYFINGSESNFTAVTTLLRNRGIDLDHKRFLILQGEVESIAQMKPKATTEHDDGLLEYLEDIIGTSKYKAPIEESSAEVESLTANCVEKQSRVQHVEKERKNLEGKRDEIISLIESENQLAVKQSALYQVFVAECEDNAQVTGSAISELEIQLAEEVERRRGDKEYIERLKRDYSAQTMEVDEFEHAVQLTTKVTAKLDKERVRLEERKKHFDVKMSKLEKTLAAGKCALSESNALLGRLREDLKRNLQDKNNLENQLKIEESELELIRSSLQEKTQGFSDQVATKQKTLEPWMQKITQKRSAIVVTQSELDILHKKLDAGAQALDEVDGRIRRLQSDKSLKATELQESTAAREEINRRMLTLRQALQKRAYEEPEVRSKLSFARQKADEAKASLSTAQIQGKVLTGLVRLKESGRISGFHGRLGNLGAIDQKYDIAISTACPALDNLVVDNVEVGQQCIEYLRKNSLGRANFILLDQLSERNLEPIQTPEGVSRLFDLVKASDEKFRPAFFSVLQNTLVANDLSQANRIAYASKRWRVVTLDGQLIDKSGTMSGGGSRTARGAMSSKIVQAVSSEKVSELEMEQDVLEKNFQKFQLDQRADETALREAEGAIPNFETTIQKCTMELESIERHIVDAKHRKQDLVAPKAQDDGDITKAKELEHHIMTLEKEICEQSEGAAAVQAEIDSLQEKIMQIGGVKLRVQKAKVDDLKEQIGSLVEEIGSGELSKAKAEQQIRKHDKTATESESELKKIVEDLRLVQEDTQMQAHDSAHASREAEAASKALATKKEALQVFKENLDRRVTELNEARIFEIEQRNELEERQKLFTENEKRLAYWQEKLGKLSLHEISDLDKDDGELSLVVYTKDELADLEKDVLKSEIVILEERIQNADIDVGVLSEYRRRVDELASRSQDLADAVALRDATKKRCEELRRLRLEGFMEGFSIISLRLKEMYQMITMGGNAELELVDSLDPFSEGIMFSVMPPKKSWKNISNLSGGEKTLSSLALVFALHHYKPTPLYVMDEIDAALDFRNVSIVASYIKERTRNAQFIVISLRNNMFELASRLVGVYKVNHMTKSVTMENKDYISR